MVVPAAVVELDEAGAALGEAAGEQAVRGERAVARGAAVHFKSLLGFASVRHQFRHGGLHAEGEFVLLDAGGDFRIAGFAGLELVEAVDRLDQFPLRLRRVAGRGAHVVDGIAGGLEFDALQVAGQEAAAPLPRGDRLALAASDAGQHDEAGQVLAFAAEAVEHPRAHRGPARDDRAGVHEGMGGIVVDLLGVHRADHGDLVGVFRDVGEGVADLDAGFAVAGEVVLGAHAVECLALELGELLALGEGLRHRFSVQLTELRFEIEGFQMRRPAGHAEEDHPLDLGRQRGAGGTGQLGA